MAKTLEGKMKENKNRPIEQLGYSDVGLRAADRPSGYACRWCGAEMVKNSDGVYTHDPVDDRCDNPFKITEGENDNRTE
jgi:hypothetical protein